MNIKRDYNKLLNMYEKLGADNFFNTFDKSFPKYGLYDMSQDWLDNKQYILKFHGEKGDLVISWE